MSSEGPKMVGGRGGGMGRPGMAEKWENPVTHRGGSRCVRRLDLGASGGGSP